MFTIEFVVREAGKVEIVTGAEYRTKKAAEKAMAGYVEWEKKRGKPGNEIRVIRVVH